MGDPAQSLPAMLRTAVICLVLFALIAAFGAVTIFERSCPPEPTPWDLQAARFGSSWVQTPVD